MHRGRERSFERGRAPRLDEDGANPRLRSFARLRFDKITGRHLLLIPERGFLLNETAFEVLELCTGDLSISKIVDILVERHAGDRARVEREVVQFLRGLTAARILESPPARAP